MVSAVLLLVPGIFVERLHSSDSAALRLARAILWSVALWGLLTFLAALAGVSFWVVVALVALASAGLIGAAWRAGLLQAPDRAWWLVAGAATLAVGVLLVPFAVLHDGLPTGDSQKAIIWANEVIRVQHLPDYGQALERLNRDRVDFFTPALHTLTAALLQLSGASLVSVGVFSVASAMAAALVAAALVRQLWPELPAWWPEFTAALLVLTHFRFLRYLREPGYHYQNLIGELVLWGLLLLIVSLTGRWRWRDAVLAALLAVLLLLTHQFSAFVAAFVLVPPGLVLLALQGRQMESRGKFLLPLAVVLGAAVAGWRLNLYGKISDIFTLEVHLASLAPAFADYFDLLGTVWLALGLWGVLVWALEWRHVRQAHGKRGEGSSGSGWVVASFVVSCAVIVGLSQGPRLGIDIPPVRALLYLIVPWSVWGSWGAVRLWQWLAPRRGGRVIAVAVFAGLAVTQLASAGRAFEVSHTLRTNSTLTPGQLKLVDYLAAQPDRGAVLVDDFNRRSGSWLVLSGRAMFTRIASDISRQMDEARQSALRDRIYQRLLTYEKIYALGSRPMIVPLLAAEGIGWVVGVEGSSATVLAANPALREAARADGLRLFGVGEAQDPCGLRLSPAQEEWLRASSTLASDFGGPTDTHDHLPVSLRTTRLGGPTFVEGCTVRTTRAPVVRLEFNVADYVRVLWDTNDDGHLDGPLTLLLAVAGEPEGVTIRGTGARVGAGVQEWQFAPHEVVPDQRGRVSVQLDNPNEHTVVLDLAALGLALEGL